MREAEKRLPRWPRIKFEPGGCLVLSLFRYDLSQRMNIVRLAFLFPD